MEKEKEINEGSAKEVPKYKEITFIFGVCKSNPQNLVPKEYYEEIVKQAAHDRFIDKMLMVGYFVLWL